VTRVWHHTRRALVVIVLLLTVWLGLKEGSDAFRGAETSFQRLASLVQLEYGVAAVAALVAFHRRSRWLLLLLLWWGLGLVATATLAPVAWGGAPWISGLGSGIATALAVAGVIWAALSTTTNDR